MATSHDLDFKCPGIGCCLRPDWAEAFWTTGRDSGTSQYRCRQCGLDNLSPDHISRGSRSWTRAGSAHAREIFASADKGCETCQLLKAGLLRCREEPEVSDDYFEHPDVITKLLFTEARGPTCTDKNTFHVTVSFVLGPSDLESPLRREFEFQSRATDLPTGVRSARPVASESNSDSCLQLLKKWLFTCDVQHRSYCSRIEPVSEALLPARLLYIGGAVSEDRPVLRQHAGPSLRYTTLTYCWGQSNFVNTSVQTLASFLTSGVDLVSLRKDFQDAIAVTRALDVSYIWIDALCIIQDDKDDWRRESAKMASIYEQSYLTIAAVSTTLAGDGLFLPRQIHKMPLCAPWCDAGIYVTQKLPHGYISEERDPTSNKWPSPRLINKCIGASHNLFNRGWCFQELAISPRTVFYSANELLWECRYKDFGHGGTQCECGAYNEVGIIIPSIKNKLSGPLRYEKALEEIENFQEVVKSTRLIPYDNFFSISDTWIQVVENYTYKKLTFEDDVFPAISGLARKFYSKGMGSYFAGLWERDITRGLAWASDEAYAPLRRSTLWRAPSWSWASVVGPVIWMDTEHPFRESEILILYAIVRPVTLGAKNDDCCDISNEVSTATFDHVLRGDDPFGQLRSATLTIRGRLVPAKILHSEGLAAWVQNNRLILETGVILEDVRFDVRRSTGEHEFLYNEVFHCLRIFQRRKGSKRQTPKLSSPGRAERVDTKTDHFLECSLVLRTVPDRENCFERVGIHYLWAGTSSSIYEGVEETLITLR